jgi:pimeloyl-ACP methyl ester carboxylesterase
VIFVNALGYREAACVIGHDFGAVASSMCALMRPDIFKSQVVHSHRYSSNSHSVIMMSHPFKGSPTLPFNTVSTPHPTPEKYDIHKALAELPQPRKAYKWYYSTAPAAAEMDNPPEELHEFLRGYFHLKSADWKGNNPHPLKAWEATEIAKMPYYYIMPLQSTMRESIRLSMAHEDPDTVSLQSARWLPDSDLAVYVSEYKRTGFQGGLNWYRVATDPRRMRDVEVFAGRKIDVPSLFIAGKRDWGTYQEPGVIERMGEKCTKFRGVRLLDGAGHWVQQEQAEKVVELVAEFLRGLELTRSHIEFINS